ncbi:MAG: hypothetical protein K6T85_01770 [Gorillibacterium sp.]|nr:hypothetical protein [Gorillibacterium sp.]
MSPTSATGYSYTGGGAHGYINVGGWNTTLTDVSASPQETVGVIRWEGSNAYIYAKAGSGACTKGHMLGLCTATPDSGGFVSPLRLTQLAVNTLTVFHKAFCMAIQDVPADNYAWFFREGICTLQLDATGGVSAGGYLKPSTSTGGCWVQAATACGYAFALQNAAAGGTTLAYVNFHAGRQA